jgi:peptidoglycan hydrolase-like protein with peptidoglycan-binding domain
MPINENPLRARTGARALIAAGASLVAGSSVAATTEAAPIHGGDPAHIAVITSLKFLAAGASGSAVRQLQRVLQLQVNGVFGPATRAAVIRFQRQHRLLVDGVVGPRTRRALHLRDRIIPAPPPAPRVPTTSASAPTASSTATASSGYSIPSGIVMCESGGNWHAVNPTTGAGGAYQILPSTWAAYGGSGLPQDASPAEQNAIAAKIWASSGSGAWSC